MYCSRFILLYSPYLILVPIYRPSFNPISIVAGPVVLPLRMDTEVPSGNLPLNPLPYFGVDVLFTSVKSNEAKSETACLL